MFPVWPVNKRLSGFPAWRHSDLDDSGTQKAMLQLISPLKLLQDLLVAVARNLYSLHRLMDVRIKYLSRRFDRRQARPAQNFEQVSIDQLHPLVELLGNARFAKFQ